MSGKKSQETSYKESNQTEDPASRSSIEIPVSYACHLLQEEQYTPCLGSSTTDSLLAMLDSLTDYIVETVGSEVNNSNIIHTSPQDGEAEGNDNRESTRVKDAPFSMFDQMPGTRKNG